MGVVNEEVVNEEAVPTPADDLPVNELDELIQTAEEMVHKLKRDRSAVKEQLSITEENLVRWDARLITLKELKESGFSRFLKDDDDNHKKEVGES